jgi:hypothetical protein
MKTSWGHIASVSLVRLGFFLQSVSYGYVIIATFLHAFFQKSADFDTTQIVLFHAFDSISCQIHNFLRFHGDEWVIRQGREERTIHFYFESSKSVRKNSQYDDLLVHLQIFTEPFDSSSRMILSRPKGMLLHGLDETLEHIGDIKN